MTTSKSQQTSSAKAKTSAAGAPAKVESEKAAPVNIELETPSDEPVAAPEAAPTEKIQTDVRAKLARKSDKEDAFVPSNPVALEKAASEVAKQENFELTRGTSIGARLIARSRNMA
jgi:ribosomal protein L14E/L6E/L27E